MANFNIIVLQWEKYNPRKDVKHPRWFAFSNRMIEDPDFFSFSSGEFKAWIYILSQCSQRNASQIVANVTHLQQVCAIKIDEFEGALKKLSNIGAIRFSRTRSVRICTDRVRDTTDITLQDITLQDTPARAAAAVEAEATFQLLSPKDLDLIPEKVRSNWAALYEEAYLQRESIKIITWLVANPRKNKRNMRGWIKFLSNWFERGWSNHQKGIGTNKPKKKNNSSVVRDEDL